MSRATKALVVALVACERAAGDGLAAARAAAERLASHASASQGPPLEMLSAIRASVGRDRLAGDRWADQKNESTESTMTPSQENNVIEVGERSAAVYRRLEKANTSALLETIGRLPLVKFEIEFDSVLGRRQLGVIGEEIEEIVPEAVQVGRRAFPLSNSSVVMIDNFVQVDQNAIFMHALGATRELASRQESLNSTVEGVTVSLDASRDEMSSLMERAHNETAAAGRMRLKIEAERERRAAAESNLAEVRFEVERSVEDFRAGTMAASAALTNELALERASVGDAARRERRALEIAVREALVGREDELRGETEAASISHRFENEREIESLRREAEIARVEAEARARAEADRANEDLHLGLMRARAEEDRRRLLEGVALCADYVARGATALLDDPKMMSGMVAAVVSLIAAACFSREAAVMARHLAEAYFGTPSLVRETSRYRFARLWRWLRRARSISKRLVAIVLTLCLHYAGRSASMLSIALRRACYSPDRRARLAQADRMHEAARADKHAAQDAVRAAHRDLERSAFLDGVVLADDVRARLVQLAASTRSAKSNGAPFRHALLYGPPGTGKTLCAKRLAKASGLSYALMSGGDVGPLGANGVTALHALFRWARASDDGVLVFIDEAEAFLASRSKQQNRLTEHMRNALNAFLYQTGSPTSSFVIVLATNRPADLDPAVLDRVDETLYLGLPSLDARSSLLPLYYDRYLAPVPHRRRFCFWCAASQLDVAADVDPELLENIAARTEGFSGRELEKLIVAVQSVAYGQGGKLDRATFLAVVEYKIDEHRRKVDLATAADRREAPQVCAATVLLKQAEEEASPTLVQAAVVDQDRDCLSGRKVDESPRLHVATAFERKRGDNDDEHHQPMERTFPWTPRVLLRTPPRQGLRHSIHHLREDII